MLSLATAVLALAAGAGATRFVEPPKTAPRPSQPRTLTLDAEPPAPALPPSNAVAALTRQIRAELEELERESAGEDDTRAARSAYRRVTFDLLFHGGTADDQAMAIAGLRLADSRAALDRLLQSASKSPDAAAIREDLREFVAAGAGGVQPLPPAATPEVVLAPMLEPLRRAVGYLENRAGVAEPNAWPSLAEAGPAAQSEANAQTAEQVLRAALDEAAWLTPQERASWEVLVDMANQEPRRSKALATFLCAATALLRGEGSWDAVRMRAGTAALAARPSVAAAEALGSALAAAQQVRLFDVAALPALVRPAAREIQLQARRSAAKLALLLPEIVGSPQAAVDPALGSAIDAQVGAQRDLERLRAAAAWPDQLAAVRAGSKDPFERVVRAWAAALAQPAQRATARASMDQFAAQLALFAPVRLEPRLRMGDPAAVAAAGGRSAALLAEIDRRRDAWAAEWTRGSAGPAADGMRRTTRVMDAIATVAAFEARESVEPALARWGGFAAPPGGLGVHPLALTARAQLAIEALLARDDHAVDEQLAALQRDVPVAWLVSQAADRLDPWLKSRGGVLAQLDAACSGPTRDSWLGSERAALMRFSRYAREHAGIADATEAERALELRSYLAALARGIASRQGERTLDGPVAPEPLPTAPPASTPPRTGAPAPGGVK